MSKPVRVLLIIIVVVGLGIQIFRPDRSVLEAAPSDAITAALQVPEDVHTLLVRSCYDCHSNQTRWPWYSNVAPVSWLVANDVGEGRQHLNFSIWATYPSDRASAGLKDIAELVSSRDMPIPAYTYLHREARLTDAEIARVSSWATAQRNRLLAQPGTEPR